MVRGRFGDHAHGRWIAGFVGLTTLGLAACGGQEFARSLTLRAVARPLLAFVVEDNEVAHIYTSDLAGMNVRRLSDVPGIDPAWAPDGTRLAFVGQDQQAIYIVGSDGSILLTTRLPEGKGATHPVWNPDGTFLAYISSDRESGQATVRIVEMVAGKEHASVQGVFQAWTSTRTLVYQDERGQLEELDLRTGRVAPLSLPEPENGVNIAGTAKFSNDGDRVAWMNILDGREVWVYASTVGSGDLSRVAQIIRDTDIKFDPGLPVFSRDSRKLAVPAVSRRGSASLSGVDFVDVKNGWAVGGNGTIVHTSDGGETWNSQRSGTAENLYAVAFVDVRDGWAVGEWGTILHTSDGGDTWSAQTSNAEQSLVALVFVDVKNGWAVGRNGTIVRTSDGGETWRPQQSGTAARLGGVAFVDVRDGWAVGESGTILHTSDGGETWSPQRGAAREDSLKAVAFADAKNGWAVGRSWVVGRSGTILGTSDGGETWNAQQADTADLSFNNVAFADERMGWVVSETAGEVGVGGKVLRTTDGGNTWSAPTRIAWRGLKDLALVGHQSGWAVGVRGTIVRTVDGGNTWTVQDGAVEILVVDLEENAIQFIPVEFTPDYLAFSPDGAYLIHGPSTMRFQGHIVYGYVNAGDFFVVDLQTGLRQHILSDLRTSGPWLACCGRN